MVDLTLFLMGYKIFNKNPLSKPRQLISTIKSGFTLISCDIYLHLHHYLCFNQYIKQRDTTAEQKKKRKKSTINKIAINSYSNVKYGKYTLKNCHYSCKSPKKTS